MRFKRGVDRGVKPETAYWMGRLEAKFFYWFGSEPTCTSAFREGPGGHGRREAWDLQRVNDPSEEEFCRKIQQEFGSYLGVVLEPEWGQGAGFTGPHFHFQLKKPGRWSVPRADLERAARYVVEFIVELRKEEMPPSVREELEAMGDLLKKALGW
jgi:hypothetical protein